MANAFATVTVVEAYVAGFRLTDTKVSSIPTSDCFAHSLLL
jgi:hypothetical protein